MTTGGSLALGASSASAASPGSNLGGLSSADGYTTTANLSPGSIQHVWLIILENKSYNAEFSGVNADTYLWQTLPSQGALLQNYYGTGHTSMDNYITLVSGQAPSYDVQSDCSDADTQFASNTPLTASTNSAGNYNGSDDGIVDTGTAGGDTQSWFLGQAVSALGPNAPITSTSSTNGCTYPTDVATLFDQFNQAGVTWKGYAQDLGGSQQTGATSYQSNTVPGRESASTCGAPGNPDGQPENPVSNPTFLSGSEGYPLASTVATGTATGGTAGTSTTAGTLTVSGDQSASFPVGDEIIITGGTGQNESGTVASVAYSSPTTTVTLKAAWTPANNGTNNEVAPDSTSTYEVGLADTSSYTGASLVAGPSNVAGPDGLNFSSTNPEYSDQYVAKHFPFAWFESLSGVGGSGTTPLTEPVANNPAETNPSNCDAYHIANLDDPTYGLEADLSSNNVPNFSWITPDNCSDGHDSACKGNNLSGAFGVTNGQVNLNDPIYTPSTTSGANCTSGGNTGTGSAYCGSIPSYDPEATTPRNFTGGTYSADLFLAYYIPLIERSAAYQHGLIDVTFDEGEPSFVYGGNTFNNIGTTGPASSCSTSGLTNAAPYNSSGGCYPTAGTGTTPPSGAGPEGTNYPSSTQLSNDAPAGTEISPTGDLAPNDKLTYGSGGQFPGADSQFGADDLFADSAGETINGQTEASEPTGPNSPLATDANGNQQYFGPGFNLDVDRPVPCSATVTTNCVSGEVLGDGGTTSATPKVDSYTTAVSTGATSVTDSAVNADDTGREITTVNATYNSSTKTYSGGDAVGSTAYDSDFQVNGAALPAGDAAFVGEVTQNGPLFPTTSGGTVVTSSFGLVDDNGNPVTVNTSINNLTLSGECDPATTSGLTSTCTANETPDPLFDATDPTTGGGDTGSVLISPYITPGTVSSVDYNHYSWLRTMEDLFDVNSCSGTNDVPTVGTLTVCGGTDGLGHLGYAAQTKLADFGSDVFTAPNGDGYTGTALPESPLPIVLPIAGILLLGGFALWRSRRYRRVMA